VTALDHKDEDGKLVVTEIQSLQHGEQVKTPKWTLATSSSCKTDQ